MARKCSSCGNNGHNSRTCSGPQRSLETNNGVCGGGGGVRLFGVQLHAVGSSSVPSPMKKCFSMECLSSSAPAYYAAALAAAGASSSSPSASSSSSLVSVDEAATEKVTNGYLSDGLMGSRAQERKKGVPWTEDEHRRFLAGLEKLGKGDWRGISRHFVTTRTPTQVASHAQKYFLRQSCLTQKKRRTSLFDVVENSEKALSSVSGGRGARLRGETSTMSETEFPALSLGISSSSSRATKPEHALPPSLLLAVTPPPPRCSAAMSTSPPHLVAPRHHPSSLSLTTTTSKPPAAISSLRAPPPPDLELKISTAAARKTTDQAGPSPRTPPFFGTIRVT